MNHTINITCLVFVPINDTDSETVLESSRTFLLVSGQSRRMIKVNEFNIEKGERKERRERERREKRR